MKRISRAARVTVVASVAAVSLLLGQCFVPLANADEIDPVPLPAAAESSDVEKPADKVKPVEKAELAEKAEPPVAKPAEDPAPVEKPAPPAAEEPAPPSGPDLAPAPPSGQAAGPVEKAPPVVDPTTEPPTETPPVSLPAGSPQELSGPPPIEDPRSQSASRQEIPAASGSEDAFAPVPEDSLTATSDSVAIGLEESLVEGVVEPMGIDPGDLCAIDGDGYPTLDAAIAAAASGQTVAVLKSFTHTSPVEIDGKNLTFDLSEGSITIDTRGTTNSYALKLTNATITLVGGGYVDVMGDLRGVHARNASITVRYATADWGTGAYAESGGKITVRGDAKGYLIGAFAYGAGSTVTVDDDAMATASGAGGQRRCPGATSPPRMHSPAVPAG